MNLKKIKDDYFDEDEVVASSDPRVATRTGRHRVRYITHEKNPDAKPNKWGYIDSSIEYRNIDNEKEFDNPAEVRKFYEGLTKDNSTWEANLEQEKDTLVGKNWDSLNTYRRSERQSLRDSANGVDLIDQLYKVSKEELGDGELQDGGYRENVITHVINDYFLDFDNWKDYDQDCPYKMSEYGLHELAYDVINYDLISVDENGRVYVKESNHPKIARIIAKLIPQEILKKQRGVIFGEHNWID